MNNVLGNNSNVITLIQYYLISYISVSPFLKLILKKS